MKKLSLFVVFTFMCAITFNIFTINVSAVNVNTYSKSSDGETYLSANFQVKEFACNDGSDKILIDLDLVNYIQKIRDYFGKPVTINSGYRTDYWNKKVGGATNSYHKRGQAADIVVSGISPNEVAKYAETIGMLGIGVYKSFTHVDTRTSKYFWDNTNGSQRAVSTFGGTSSNITDDYGENFSTSYAGYYIVNTQNDPLNMRVGSGTSYTVVTKVPKGETIYVYEANSSWAYVEYNGYTGYCSMQYLSKTTPSECDCSTDYAGDYIVTTESTDLNMRSDHSSNSSIVTKIPKGATVYVSKANGSWAHVEYNGNSGYCSMQYLTKTEPAPVVPSKPEYLNISDCNSMTSIVLSWSSCENTDYYDIRYYTSDGTIINTISGWTDTQYVINLDYGDYYFNVASVNNNGNYTFSENFNFSVSKGDLVPTCVETYNNHIYALYDVVTSYENANRYAQALGGHLATITSKEENDYIISLKNKGSFTSQHCWLGATDLDNEGTWKWCTDEEFSYSNWDINQPDNCSDLYGTENYLEIWENGCWNDANNCNTILKGFIIEIEPLTEVKFKEYNNHTYYVFNNTLSWTEANQYAQNMGGYLVEINNEKENEFIHSLAQECGLGGYWISLKDTGYTNFKNGEPNNNFGLENYYHIYSETGEWNDADNCQGLSCSIGFIVEMNTASQKNIKLNNPKLSVQETESYQLQLLNIDDSKNIVWISDDTSIATVDNGLVTGISTGTVNIYAIVDGTSYCSKVTVYPYQENSVLGDCNNNGKVTFIDLVMLKKYVVGINLGNTINLYNADINHDAEINILDIISLKQILINSN